MCHIELKCRVGGIIAYSAVLTLAYRAKIVQTMHGSLCHDLLLSLRAHVDEHLVEAAYARICIVRDKLRVLCVQGRLILDVAIRQQAHGC